MRLTSYIVFYNYVDLLDEELKLTTDYGEHLKAWLYNTSLDEVRIFER